jgi:hypothetical protein
MKLKSLGWLVLCSTMMVVLSSCQPVGPLREGLNFEKSVFAKVDDAGKVTFLDKAEYERGEKVHFALMKVGKFQKGKDGKDWVDSDLKVRQGNKMIFEKKGLMGEAGHVDLKDDMAESPTGVFTATASLKPGDYSMELTVYDKIGGGKARDSGTFTVK